VGLLEKRPSSLRRNETIGFGPSTACPLKYLQGYVSQASRELPMRPRPS
jgi:hypothetical protein